jgi:trk system potassium uptake protein
VGVRRAKTGCSRPSPGDQLFAGDQIYVFTHADDVNRTLEIFGKAARKQERIVIIGGGNVGLGCGPRAGGADRPGAREDHRETAPVAEMAADRWSGPSC